MKIVKPVLIVDRAQVGRNILRMQEKIKRAATAIRFRPHFKTHQSAQVGEIFREAGITSIAVSSVSMAHYFASYGWRDITIAVLHNRMEIDGVRDLLAMEGMNLELLVDTRGTIRFLDEQLKGKWGQGPDATGKNRVNTWIKIDTGYHRTGLEWNRKDEIFCEVETLQKSKVLHFKGLLTHSGHSYRASSRDEIKGIYSDTVIKMEEVRNDLKKRGTGPCEISIGDTPTCSLVDVFYGVDEVRCGNFVYYDLMQLGLGSCRIEDIAVAVACPVIGRYSHRREVVVYGGAVHLSASFILSRTNEKIFGLVALPNEDGQGWGMPLEETFISSLSQEHGVAKSTPKNFSHIRSADTLMILPVHSCLTADLLKESTLLV